MNLIVLLAMISGMLIDIFLVINLFRLFYNQIACNWIDWDIFLVIDLGVSVLLMEHGIHTQLVKVI